MMHYDMVVTMPGIESTTTKTWVNKNKIRTEMTMMGMETISLFDLDTGTMYTYLPAQNMAMKMSLDPGASETAAQEASSIMDYNPTNLGTESLNGIVCQVVEYTIQGNMAKMWISKDRGLPVKVEQTTAQGKIIIEYKNYDFSNIPDSMFELPEGVQIIETGQ